MLLLVACLLAHTMLGLLSELHEAGRHDRPAPSHQHAGPAEGHDHDHGDALSDDAGPSLHGVLHTAHCCGHAGGVALSPTVSLHDFLRHSPPLSRRVAAAIPPDPSNPFRPPIAA